MADDSTKEKKRILIIDDEEDMVEIMKSVLLDEGYDIMTAFNGEEGLRQVEKSPPHLIVLDMNMPKMGGIAFYHSIYDKETERPKYPVLIVTARANLAELFKELNVDGFMTKPFRIDDFMKEANLIISKRYDRTPSGKASVTNRQKKLLLVENDTRVFGNIINTFLTAGYEVVPSNSAIKAIELAMADPPDIILIDLKIDDLPGDLLACKFRQMSKTMDIPIVLYASHGDQLQLSVTKEICKKVGLRSIVTSNDPEQLLKECSYVLKS